MRALQNKQAKRRALGCCTQIAKAMEQIFLNNLPLQTTTAKSQAIAGCSHCGQPCIAGTLLPACAWQFFFFPFPGGKQETPALALSRSLGLSALGLEPCCQQSCFLSSFAWSRSGFINAGSHAAGVDSVTQMLSTTPKGSLLASNAARATGGQTPGELLKSCLWGMFTESENPEEIE